MHDDKKERIKRHLGLSIASLTVSKIGNSCQKGYICQQQQFPDGLGDAASPACNCAKNHERGEKACLQISRHF